MHVTDLGVVVHAGMRLERGCLRSVLGLRLDLDGLTRLDRVDAFDGELLTTSQSQRLQVLAVRKFEGQDSHPDKVRPMDTLEALRDDSPYTQQQGALGGPVARGA